MVLYLMNNTEQTTISVEIGMRTVLASLNMSTKLISVHMRAFFVHNTFFQPINLNALLSHINISTIQKYAVTNPSVITI